MRLIKSKNIPQALDSHAGDLKLDLTGGKLTISGKRIKGLKLSQGHPQSREVPVRKVGVSWIAPSGNPPMAGVSGRLLALMGHPMAPKAH